MRRALLILVVGLIPLSACTATKKSFGVDARFRLVCSSPNCESLPARDFTAYDGDLVDELGHSIACISGVSGSTRSTSFSILRGDQTRFDVRGLVSSPDGANVLNSGCELEIQEGPDTYRGSCGGGAPTEDRPCQIVSIQTGEASGGESELILRISCEGLPLSSNPTRTFDLTDSANVNSPAEIRLFNCLGL